MAVTRGQIIVPSTSGSEQPYHYNQTPSWQWLAYAPLQQKVRGGRNAGGEKTDPGALIRSPVPSNPTKQSSFQNISHTQN